MQHRFCTCILAVLFCVDSLGMIHPTDALAQEKRGRNRGARPSRDRDDTRDVSADAEKKFNDLQEQAKKIGPWDQEAQTIHQAHVNVFQMNGWTSESDQYALSLLQQVTNISPWNPKQREETFLNGVQSRLSLSAMQRQLVADEMRRESMQIAMKHMGSMFPVVMEIAQTRAEQKPFTPEQIQKWSQNLKPIMDDAMAALQRTSKKLEATMSEDQRQKLKTDLDAVVRRHNDVEKMVQKWQAGQWNPTEWGLDNDPIHAAAMAEYRAKVAQTNAKVAVATANLTSSPNINTANETEWRKYVQWFVAYYTCDERQVSQAEGILKSCEKEAADYLRSRGREIEQVEARRATADSDSKKELADTELARLRRPISEIFERLKKRLNTQVLTTEQRRKMPAEEKPVEKRASAGQK